MLYLPRLGRGHIAAHPTIDVAIVLILSAGNSRDRARWHGCLYARTISHVLDLLRYLVPATAAIIVVGFAAGLAFWCLRRRRTVPVLFAVASLFVALLAGTSIVGMIANMP